MPPAADITPQMGDLLAPASIALLRGAGAIAAERGFRLFLVGGTVRDLLLGRPVMDLDLLVERREGHSMEAAPALAAVLARELGGEPRSHSRFGTVNLLVPGNLALDLASARREDYAAPGALPTVRPAAVEDDLARRDFTVNAMAADLAPEGFGALLDPHDGMADLDARTLQVLHPRSFVDDATRILRGIRYEARLALRMSPRCETMAREHARYLGSISGDRLRRDLERIFQEAAPEAPLERAQALGVLQAIHPALAWDGEASDALARLRASGRRVDPLACLALLAARLPPQAAEALARRLNAPARWARTIRDAQALGERLPHLARAGERPSRVYSELSALEPVAIAAWSALSRDPAARNTLGSYLYGPRQAAPALRGPDLVALGVPRGPMVGRLLRELRDARLDGILASREEEVAMVRRRVAETGPGPR